MEIPCHFIKSDVRKLVPMRNIFKFHGGIHPPENKSQSTQFPIQTLPLPARLFVPLQQHMGQAAQVCVQVGDMVYKGQTIANAQGSISAAIHAPTSGKIISIRPQTLTHPSGLADLCVEIAPDGLENWQAAPIFDYQHATHLDIRDYLRDMGVVGLGGALFPSHLKLGTGQAALNTLIINAAECEPYISCDDMLLRERAADCLKGIAVIRDLLQAKEVLIGIEDNKPEAVQALKQAIQAGQWDYQLVVIPTLYPSGGAKQLIKLLTNIEVPHGMRATQFGVQCFNIATAYSVYQAIAQHQPVISRIVTITGNVERPQNVEVLLGTPIQDLLTYAGNKSDTTHCIMGGSMMGIPVFDLQAPISKASNCIIAASDKLFPAKPAPMPCIRCAKCAEVCPAELQPQDLYWFAKSKNFAKAQESALFDCIECGACAFVCPSEIPLVDYYRFAKSEIWSAEREKKAADLARSRHEWHELRKEREKTEKAARLAAKTAALNTSSTESEKQAKIQAALARLSSPISNENKPS